MVLDRGKLGLAIAGGVLALVLLAGALGYASDYGVEATITEKGQDGGGYYVIATTEIGGLDTQRYLGQTQWALIQEGHFVVYHVRSGTIEVYTSEGGSLLYRG